MHTGPHSTEEKITPQELAIARFPAPHVTTIDADEIAHANRPSTKMLLAMGRIGKPIYEGTVPGHIKARRRAANKAARAARKAAR